MENKKAQQAYYQRDNAFKKAREQAVKQEHLASNVPGGPGSVEATRRKKEVERRRKIEEEAQIKVFFIIMNLWYIFCRGGG